MSTPQTCYIHVFICRSSQAIRGIPLSWQSAVSWGWCCERAQPRVVFYRLEHLSFSSGNTQLSDVEDDQYKSNTLHPCNTDEYFDAEGNRLVQFDNGPALFLGSFIVVAGWIVFNVVVVR